MDIREVARALGRRGGMARAKALTPARRRQIASQGGLSRSISRHAHQRVADNFRAVDAILTLQAAYARRRGH